jgi:hypothetical protein
MERNQRRYSGPGREHRPDSSRRAYSDEQEKYRNPRNEYRDDDSRRNYDDDIEMSRYGSPEHRDRGDRDLESGESNRYGASERGYGDRDHRTESRELYEPGYAARRERQTRDTWSQPESGEFSESRTRWPRDDRYRTEPRSQNWPHSRGGRVSEYGYFDEESGPSGSGGRQQGSSRFGYGSRPQSTGYRGQQGEYGYGGEQQSGYGFGQPSGMEYGSRGFGEDYSGRGPKNYSRSDERIKEDICDELSSDPECDAENVEIEVKDGMVTLSGEVPSRKMKHRAEDIADQARGVKDVENRIRVKGRGGQRASRSGQVGTRDERSDSSNAASNQRESRQTSRSAKKSS